MATVAHKLGIEPGHAILLLDPTPATAELLRAECPLAEFFPEHRPGKRYEAAFFYALFLRGYPLQKLRADIDVSPQVLERWQRLAADDPWYKTTVERMLTYRKEVLAIFDSLVLRELHTPISTQ